MPATRGSSSSGASAVDQAGSEQQADPSIDVDPTNETICFFHNEQGMSVMDTDFENRTVGIFCGISGIPAKRISIFRGIPDNRACCMSLAGLGTEYRVWCNIRV